MDDGTLTFSGVVRLWIDVLAQQLRLGQSDRKDLAVQALARSETVSDLAARHGVSRKFVYQQVHKAVAALDDAFLSATPDNEVLTIPHFSGHELRPTQPCCSDQRTERIGPNPCRGSGDANRVRASQPKHAVQHMNSNVHLRRAAPVRVRA